MSGSALGLMAVVWVAILASCFYTLSSLIKHSK